MKAKKIIKWGCGIVAVLFAAVLLLVGSFVYVTKHKITDIDSSISNDGQYEVLFQNVGEPNWPFGDSHARIVLKRDDKTITKHKFDVANDGGVLYADNWSVSWGENCVEVIISGEEQSDILYILSFDGTVQVSSPEDLSENPMINISENAVENQKGESVFAVSVEDFIDCYNSVYRQTHEDGYLLPTDADSWRCYDERSPRFGYEAVRYQFSEDWSAWPMPTVSVYAAESGEIYEVRMTFDDHGYQEKLHAKFKDLCSCLIKMACPKISDEDIDEAFSELYSLAYDNFFGDHHGYGNPERPPLSKLLKYKNIGFYCFYGSGNIEICMIPLTPLAMELLYEEGTNVQNMLESPLTDFKM